MDLFGPCKKQVGLVWTFLDLDSSWTQLSLSMKVSKFSSMIKIRKKRKIKTKKKQKLKIMIYMLIKILKIIWSFWHLLFLKDYLINKFRGSEIFFKIYTNDQLEFLENCSFDEDFISKRPQFFHPRKIRYLPTWDKLKNFVGKCLIPRG